MTDRQTGRTTRQLEAMVATLAPESIGAFIVSDSNHARYTLSLLAALGCKTAAAGNRLTALTPNGATIRVSVLNQAADALRGYRKVASLDYDHFVFEMPPSEARTRALEDVEYMATWLMDRP